MKEIKELDNFSGSDGYLAVDGINNSTPGGKQLLSSLKGIIPLRIDMNQEESTIEGDINSIVDEINSGKILVVYGMVQDTYLTHQFVDWVINPLQDMSGNITYSLTYTGEWDVYSIYIVLYQSQTAENTIGVTLKQSFKCPGTYVDGGGNYNNFSVISDRDNWPKTVCIMQPYKPALYLTYISDDYVNGSSSGGIARLGVYLGKKPVLNQSTGRYDYTQDYIIKINWNTGEVVYSNVNPYDNT